MARFDFSFLDSGIRFDRPDAQPSSTMRNLSRFLDNPFDDKDISIAELVAFTTDHLERMTANNSGGELSARITATSQSLDVVADCVTDDQGRLGIRKARKMAKDNFRKTLPAAVMKIVAAVIAQYGDGSPEVTECVPNGRSIFSTCRDDQVEVHLQTLVNAITAHQADLGAPLVTAATNLTTAWVTVYTASESATGAKTTTEEGKQLAPRTCSSCSSSTSSNSWRCSPASLRNSASTCSSTSWRTRHPRRNLSLRQRHRRREQRWLDALFTH
jgi:hypothetical protein